MNAYLVTYAALNGHMMRDTYVADDADDAVRQCKEGAGMLVFPQRCELISEEPTEDLRNEFPQGEFPAFA